MYFINWLFLCLDKLSSALPFEIWHHAITLGTVQPSDPQVPWVKTILTGRQGSVYWWPRTGHLSWRPLWPSRGAARYRDFGMPGANRRRCGRLPALWRVQPSCMLAFSTEQEIPHEGWMGESNALTPFSITARLSSLVCFPFLPYCVLPSPVKPLYVLAAPWPWAYNLESSPTSDPVNLQKQKPKFQPFRNPEFFPWLSGLWSAGHSVYT